MSHVIAKLAQDLPEQYQTTEDFEALFNGLSGEGGNTLEGSVVRGIVIAIEKDTVVVDVGLKSEGRIPLKEFGHAGLAAEIKVGDEVEVYVERLENRQGEASLSREKALREEAWGKLEKACEKGEHVDGIIFGRVKGGFTVDIQGAIAFLPGSQVDIRPVRDITPLMNIAQPFQILKMDRKRGNIVVSRRAILEESRAEQRTDLLAKMKEGSIVDGIVKNITDYGAFIDMGGVDGLLHVTDIAWKRVNHPSEALTIGQSVKVMVTKFDMESKRVSLGMKQMEENPWKSIQEKYKPNMKLKGRITNITDYGAFVELEDGVEGLVHVSEMSWTKKNIHPNKIVSSSQEVDVVILDVDTEKHRISLGMKQCEANPWEGFSKSFTVGDIVEGEIRNITDFGLFVGLSGEIDGLVHHSDLSWTEASDAAIKGYKKGEMVKAKILVIDAEKERISLGIKQLDASGAPAGATDASSAPAGSDTTGGVKKNDTVTCVISAVETGGIEVKINDSYTGFIKKSDLSRERQDQRPERFSVGDRVDAKVISVDKKTMKASVSIKALEMDEHKRAIEEYGSADSGASLGDILGAALSEAGKK